MPGVVFVGSNDGGVRGYSTKDGSIIWQFDTNKEFETVNGVAAKGASINGPGPVIANGMVYINSGYGSLGGRAGNVPPRRSASTINASHEDAKNAEIRKDNSFSSFVSSSLRACLFIARKELLQLPHHHRPPVFALHVGEAVLSELTADGRVAQQMLDGVREFVVGAVVQRAVGT